MTSEGSVSAPLSGDNLDMNDEDTHEVLLLVMSGFRES